MDIEQKKQKNLSKKLIYFILPLFVILLSWFGWMLKEKYFPSKAIHYHAGFIVIRDDKLVDFSSIQYMHTKPCGNTPPNKKETLVEEQIEKAHLHDYIGDVVHVHRENAVWKDLFINLKYPLNYQKTETYLNGKRVNNFQDIPIKPYDSLVIFIGENNNVNTYLKQAVTKAHIQEVEKKSDNCGS